MLFLRAEDDLLRTIYRRIKIDEDAGNADRPTYKHCVSFNTIPVSAGSSYLDDDDDEIGGFQGVQFPSMDYTMEEYYDNEGDSDYSGSEPYRGRNLSPPPRTTNGKRNSTALLRQMFKVAENGKIVRVDYPSSPSLASDAIIMTKTSMNWEKEWKQRRRDLNKRLNNKDSRFQYPDILFPKLKQTQTNTLNKDYTPLTEAQKRKEKILQMKSGYPNGPRTIICHISGRKRTWVALDWTLRLLAQDTDHIVIVADLPRLKGNFGNSRSTSRSRSRSRSAFDRHLRESSASVDDGDDTFTQYSSGYNQEDLRDKLKDIFEYVETITPHAKALKITLEIYIGKKRDMLLNLLNAYVPDFMVSTTSRWRRSDNMVVWKSTSISDKLCTIFPVPVFVLPYQRMFEFEINLQNDFSSKKVKDEEVNRSSLPASSIPLITQRIQHMIADHRSAMMDDLLQLDQSNIEDKKMKKLSIIINESLSLLRGLHEISENQDEKFEDLKRNLVGGIIRPKMRNKGSMLDVVKDVPRKSSHHHKTKSSKHSTSPSQIAFAPSVKNKDGNFALGNSMSHRITRSKSSSPERSSGLPKLQHTKSYNPAYVPNENDQISESSIPRSAALRKVRSANSIERIKSNNSSGSLSLKKKKKHRGLLSIFFRE